MEFSISGGSGKLFLSLPRFLKDKTRGNRICSLFLLPTSLIYHMETNEISTWVEQFMENIDGDYYLVDVLWNRKSLKLEIFIDTDEGVTLGECQQISRLIQSDLDLSGLAPENYMLDVSSPGLERPLKLRRQYVKNVGKVLLVELKGGAKEIGRLESVEEDGLIISPEKKGAKGRKTTYGIEKMIQWSEIEKTFVQIRF